MEPSPTGSVTATAPLRVGEELPISAGGARGVAPGRPGFKAWLIGAPLTDVPRPQGIAQRVPDGKRDAPRATVDSQQIRRNPSWAA
jgi:hypothetical protein